MCSEEPPKRPTAVEVLDEIRKIKRGLSRDVLDAKDLPSPPLGPLPPEVEAIIARNTKARQDASKAVREEGDVTEDLGRLKVGEDSAT
jgi:hypothetical protein